MMNDALTYISTALHLILVVLLWRMIYRKMRPKRFRRNISVWIAGGIFLLYVIIIANMALVVDAVWFDYLFFGPCYLLFYFLAGVLLLNLVYTIVLLAGKKQ